MSIRAGAIVLFALICLCMAEGRAPSLTGDKAIGDAKPDSFRYALSVDCQEGVVNAIVLDRSFAPVEGAKTYLSYVETDHRLLSTRISDPSARVAHELPWSAQYMRGLFILLIEKPGFRNQEIYFTIRRCYLP